MKPPISGCAAVLTCVLMGPVGSGLCQQAPPDPAPKEQQAQIERPSKTERFAFGFRLRSFPVQSLSVMDDNRIMTTRVVSQTIYDWNFNTTSRSPRLGAGPAFEVRLGQRMTLTAELLFDRLRYQKVIDIYSGRDDPSTSNDERSHTKLTETTKARLWDFPLMLHYRGLRSSGFLSHLYVAGGVTARTASQIRTTNEVTNPDGSSAKDELRAQPARRNLIGAVVGVGFRFIDDFNIKVTPEIRYTRWSGATFALDSTRSPKNQLEFGVGFTR